MGEPWPGKNTNEYKKILSRFCKLGIWSISYLAIYAWNQNTLLVDASPLNFLESERNDGAATFPQQDEDDEPNCTLPGSTNFPPDIFTQDERQQGGVVFHFLVSFYIFYALLLICDEYFVPSVESICRELKIPSDVAGATFMAASTSAPELFTNFMGTFVTQGDLGLGTIVGSAVFNILSVATVCGIGAGWALEKLKTADGRQGIPLEWWPLTRDTFFYLLSVAAIFVVMWDKRVDWFEALIMLLLYGIYIMVLCKNYWFKCKVEAMLSGCSKCCRRGGGRKQHKRISSAIPKLENTPLLITENEKGITRPARIDGDSGSELSLSSNDFDELLISKALLRSASYYIETIDWDVFTLPRGQGWIIWTEWIVSWPIRFLLRISIPDCREYEYRKWYPVTLIMCVVWIGALSYLLSWMVTIIGETLGIPESVSGLTLLAAGTSIPEIVSSVIVARQGLGSMAFSNSVGSNTFDILICLGLPWFLKGCIIAFDDVDYIKIRSAGLEYSVMLMVATMLILFLIIVANGFLLDKKVGIASLIMYLVFIVIACMLEMNMFFPVNLPVCS